jgi:23S rRNA (pseudouridine1915-N3)-methyltransferase
MLIAVAAIGKLKAGPERELFDRYIDRATAAGKSLGLTFTVRELPENRAATAAFRMTEEATALMATLPAGAFLVALDEKGKAMDSKAFADFVAARRDAGTHNLVFAIGGPDGHGDSLLDKAALRLAFGAMTWPHQLVRVMLAEQIYRAVTILSGHPYHRA